MEHQPGALTLSEDDRRVLVCVGRRRKNKEGPSEDDGVAFAPSEG